MADGVLTAVPPAPDARANEPASDDEDAGQHSQPDRPASFPSSVRD